MLPSSEEGTVLDVVWSQHNSFREFRNANTQHALRAACRVRNCILRPLLLATLNQGQENVKCTQCLARKS